MLVGLFDPALDRDLVDIADLLRADGTDHLRSIERPIGVVENHLDDRLALALEGGPVLVAGVVDQVGQLLGANARGPGQPEPEQDRVDDVRLARAVGPGDCREVLIEGNPGLAPEAFEPVEDELLDVHAEAVRRR